MTLNDSLKMHTLDQCSSNFENLKKLFPNCITEIVNENGDIRNVIDFDLLRQELSDDIVEADKER